MRLIDYSKQLLERNSIIEKIWYFESEFGIPKQDFQTTVPNSLPKLILILEGNLIADLVNETFVANAGDFVAIGIFDYPTKIFSMKPIKSIGVEFKPFGARNFFNVPMKNLKNKVLKLDQIKKVRSDDLLSEVYISNEPLKQVNSVLSFVNKASILDSVSYNAVKWSVDSIKKSNGQIDLELVINRTGFSQRYLNQKFEDILGISPKLYSQIQKFQHFYNLLTIERNFQNTPQSFLDFYYDQPHFIREFKRFSGLSPAAYQKIDNQFGRIFYK